jgi:hypothetical protein
LPTLDFTNPDPTGGYGTAPPATDPYGGYGTTTPTYGYGGAPAGTTAQPWDPNPNMGDQRVVNQQATTDMMNPVYETVPGDVQNFESRNRTNPNVAPLMGTSWEPTAEMSGRVKDGGSASFSSNVANFMYGRNPYQANADIARAQQMGAANAAQTNMLGRAALDYSQSAASTMQGKGEDAATYGLGAAGNVAQAGQKVMGMGAVGNYGMQSVANTQQQLGSGLDQRLTTTGAALGQGVADVGRQGTNVGSNYGSSLRDVANRGIATAETRGREIAAAGGRYADQLSGLENTQGPSGAQGLLNQQNNRAMNTQLALARSGRGLGGNAAAMQQAGMNVGALQQEAGNQASQLKAQEYAAWRQRQAQNLNAAAQTNIGAQTAGAGLTNQGYDIGSKALTYGGNLALGGVNTQLQGQTAGAGLAMQGNLAGASAAQSGLNASAASRQAGFDYGMQGTQANLGAQATAAGIGQAAYGQELGAYGQASAIGQGGFGQALDANAAATQAQMGYEQYAARIREMEMQGGSRLEEKISQDYAIATGQQQAANAAAAAERAALYGAGGAVVSTLATGI